MKKITALILAAGLLFLLCACGNGSAGSRIEAGTQAADETPPGTAAKEERTITEAEYTAAYQNVLKTYLKENGDMYSGYFSFCRVDGDEVPELVICPAQYHAAAALLYTYDGEKTVDLDCYGEYGTLEYVPETGIICSYGMGQGSEYHTYFKLENGKIEELGSVSRIPQNFLDENPVYDYFIGEDMATQEEYNAEIEKFGKYGKFVTAPVDYNFSDDENLPEGVYKFDYSSVFGLTDAPLSFADMPAEYYFSSGVGAWGDIITLNPDGSFEGRFTDHDYKTCYYSTYSGNFGEPEKIDEYSFVVEIQNLTVTNDIDMVRADDDDSEFIEAEPYGIENAKRLIIYMPGTPLTELTEDCVSWLHLDENEARTPGNMFVLYNEVEGNAFTGTAELD